MNRRCDAVNADGSRCENIIEPSDVSNHSIKQPFGYVFGIMCVDHWKQLDSGMKVTIREGCHPLTPHGMVLQNGHPEMYYLYAAAGMLSIRRGIKEKSRAE